jgi:hypothetical protein
LSEELESVRARLEGASAERRELIDRAEAVRSVYQRMIRSVDRLGALARLADERAEKMSVRLAAETEEGYRERIRLLEVDRRRIGSGEPGPVSRRLYELYRACKKRESVFVL